VADKLKKPDILQMKEDEMTEDEVALYGVVLEEYRYVCMHVCMYVCMYALDRRVWCGFGGV
jgi:hypothetical protein